MIRPVESAVVNAPTDVACKAPAAVESSFDQVRGEDIDQVLEKQLQDLACCPLGCLDIDQMTGLITWFRQNPAALPILFDLADQIRRQVFGRKVFFRGLIEFSNFCQNDCLYCGIRNSAAIDRYRLSPEEILSCCDEGHRLGYRTFVLQSGEDPWYDDEMMERLIQTIHQKYPDCAITLSVGEKSRATYVRYYAAGARRFLLRHETASEDHYRLLHPEYQTLANRLRCLQDLKDIGYQVGAGFMVGSPGQTARHLAADLVFLHGFQPQMVGIGPFIPTKGTPFADEAAGTLTDTLMMVALTRLILPEVLLPATTALGTLSGTGREQALQVGANVVMPNLSPTKHRKDYRIYDGKICTGDEAAECRYCLDNRIRQIGYEIDLSRGDHPDYS